MYRMHNTEWRHAYPELGPANPELRVDNKGPPESSVGTRMWLPPQLISEHRAHELERPLHVSALG